MKNKSLLMTVSICIITLSSVAQKTGTFTDTRDGKTYKTVKIGTQTWMAENLAYKASSGCWAYGNDASNIATFGYLYDWKTAKTVCPKGWHLPSDAEWDKLETNLGGEEVAGGKLKEIDTTHWASPNEGATNVSGFTALAGGYRDLKGAFENIKNEGYWWGSTETSSDWEASCIRVFNIYQVARRTDRIISYGLSVRCIKN